MSLNKKWPLYVAISVVAFALAAVLTYRAGISPFLASLDLNSHTFIGKSAWDWLSLLGVPLSLAILGYWFQQLQKRRDISKEREQRYIEEERAKEAIIQAYFDRLSGVLVDKNIIAISAAMESATQAEDTARDIDEAIKAQINLLDAVRDVIRARTLSILRRFDNDGRRKGSIIQFLSESQLINKLKLNLNGADLSGADLSQLDLNDANLSGVNFRGADLSGANLHGADLSEANLHGADLSGANLFGSSINDADLSSADLRSTNLGSANLCDADLVGASLHGADLRNSKMGGAKLSEAKLYAAKLCGADLRGAKLCEAKLRGADLHGANLGGADFRRANVRDADFKGADLSGADLSKTEEVTKDQLKHTYLCKTILPFQDLKPDRDCDKLPIHTDSGFVTVEVLSGMSIADDDPHGLICDLEVSGDANEVKDIEMSVDITHEFISDLIVTVISPEGTEVNLHDRSGASTPNISETYTVETTPELRRFIGELAQGIWALRVVDLGGEDVGKLNRFSIQIEYEIT